MDKIYQDGWILINTVIVSNGEKKKKTEEGHSRCTSTDYKCNVPPRYE